MNIGAYDYSKSDSIARRYGAWVHVDGAFGLGPMQVLGSTFDRGIETADSWATDGHKVAQCTIRLWLAFVTDPEAHRASLSIRAAYITQAADARDEMDWNPEWSRRSRCFPAYAALRQLGRDGVAELVDRCSDRARALVLGIGELKGAEVVWEPTINQGLVRFLDPSPAATDKEHDRRTDQIIEEILRTGEAFFGGTTWHGRRAMRVSVCNWRTSEDDVRRVVTAVKNVLERQ